MRQRPAEQVQTINAEIQGASLMIEDHGILTILITVGGESWQQGFGGYSLFTEGHKKEPYGIDATGYFIWRLFETLEINDWKKLKGLAVRVKHTHSQVHAIGHYLKDQWFNPGEEFEELNKKTKKLTP